MWRLLAQSRSKTLLCTVLPVSGAQFTLLLRSLLKPNQGDGRPISKEREILALGASVAANREEDEAVAVSNQGAGDEQTLIALAQKGSSTAFEALYRLHVGKVYGLCLRMTGNASEAEDCAQDAFI